MSKRALRASSVLLVAGLLAPGLRAADGAAGRLSRTAWYWQARARADKAEEAWKKVLEAAPDDPQALAAVAGFDARAGRMEKAKAALARLQKLGPGHPDLPVLRREVELGPRYSELLAQARKSVHAGRPDQAAARYRELFGPAGPPGDLALEYYQSIGGTAGGWKEAREGLRRLARRSSGEPRYRLALGELLTWKAETRRDGIQFLSDLARDPATGAEASVAWRKALLWLGSNDADLQLLRAFLRTHPGDAEIARRVDLGRRAGSLRGGYQALERGQLDAADRIFRAGGNDPAAKRGLALVAVQRGLARQRQGDLAGAQDFLEQARALAPQHRELWGDALRSVEFWASMNRAAGAKRSGDVTTAARMLQDAADRGPPDDRWHAELALGDLHLEAGELREAEGSYREVLGASPGEPDALRGLVSVLTQDGRFDEALPVNDQLVRSAPGKAFKPEWLRAELLRAQAGRLRVQDPPAALERLAAARRADPSDAWALHDLAAALLSAGRLAEAEAAIGDLERLAPALPQTRVLEARLAAARGEPARALSILSSLQPPPSDAGTVALRRQWQVEARLPALLAQAGQGQRAAAVAGLAELQAEVEDEPLLAARVASGWARIGEKGRALKLMRSAMARAPMATRGFRLELAGLLLEERDHAGVAPLLASLERDPSLRPEERRTLLDLRIALGIQVADEQRLRGQPGAALATLEPLARDAPKDPRVQAARARVWEHQDPERAHALYASLASAHPDDVEAARGAVDTDLALDRVRDARRWTDSALGHRPGDARLLLLDARVAEREGNDSATVRALDRVGVALANTTPSAPPGFSADELASLREDVRVRTLRIEDRHRAIFAGGADGRLRNGEPGLSELGELRQWISVGIPLGLAARATLRAATVELGAGAIGPTASSRLGTGGQTTQSFQSIGTELELGVATRHFDAFVGSTPIGFPVFWVLGGIRAHDEEGPFSLAVEVSRRAVTESFLSEAGVRDAGTGRRWGGVVRQGGHVDASLDPGPFLATGWAELHQYAGLNVADNLRAAGGGELAARLFRGELGEVRVGVAGSSLAFDKNLRFFTFGQGGYFSPQHFLHGGVPLRWLRPSGPLQWELLAEPGYDSYREASSPAFPLDSAASATAPAYPARASAGASFNGRAALRWRFADHFDGGLSVDLQRAPQYQEVRGSLVLRFGAAAEP